MIYHCARNGCHREVITPGYSEWLSSTIYKEWDVDAPLRGRVYITDFCSAQCFVRDTKEQTQELVGGQLDGKHDTRSFRFTWTRPHAIVFHKYDFYAEQFLRNEFVFRNGDVDGMNWDAILYWSTYIG